MKYKPIRNIRILKTRRKTFILTAMLLVSGMAQAQILIEGNVYGGGNIGEVVKTTDGTGNTSVIVNGGTIGDTLRLKHVKPLFSNDEDLQRWLEEQIETALLIISSGQEAEMPCCSDDEMCKIVKERLELMESGEATYIDGEEGFAQIRAKYGL